MSAADAIRIAKAYNQNSNTIEKYRRILRHGFASG